MAAVPELKSVRKNSFEEIKRLIASKYPIVWIESWEEERVISTLKRVAASGFNQSLSFSVWSETKGNGSGKKSNIVDALQEFLAQPKAGLFLIKDFSWALASTSLLKRALRDVFHGTKGSFKTLFLLSPRADLPEDMLKEILTIDFALPGEADLSQIF